MSCSCHIAPPCSYCVENLYECSSCGLMRNQEVDGGEEEDGGLICNTCWPESHYDVCRCADYVEATCDYCQSLDELDFI